MLLQLCHAVFTLMPVFAVMPVIPCQPRLPYMLVYNAWKVYTYKLRKAASIMHALAAHYNNYGVNNNYSLYACLWFDVFLSCIHLYS